MANIWDNVYGFLENTSKNIGKWFSDKLTLSEDTKNLLTGKSLPDFYKPGPEAANLIKSLTVEPVARAGMKVALDITKTPQYTPTMAADKFLYGTEPIKPLSTEYKESKQTLESAGFGKWTAPIAATAVFGGGLLDIAAPLGGGKKQFAEQLAKETSESVISNLLRKANVADDLVEVYAKKFANITDPKIIEKGLDSLQSMASKTKQAGSALGYTQKVLSEGEDIVRQSESTTVKKEIGDMMTKWYDKYYNLGQFMGDVEKKIGRKLTTEENAYIGARIFSGQSGKIENKLEKFGLALKSNVKDVDNGNLSTYLFNERAIERAQQGFKNPGGITEDLAKKALKELQDDMGVESFKNLEKQATGIYLYENEELLKYLQEGGVISREVYKQALKGNQHHVPFDVVEFLAEQGDDYISAGAKSFSVASQDLIKATKGTELAVDDPLNSLLRKTIKSVDLVERNKVAQTLVDLKKLSPEMNDVIIQLGKDAKVPTGYGKINVLRDGVKESYAVPQEVADAMKRMSKEQTDLMTRTASWGANALRAGATSYNPLFMITNAWRDFQTATLVSKVGFNIGDWTKGLWESFKSIANKYGTKLDDTIYKKYLDDAGQLGGYYSTYLTKIPKTVKELTQPEWKKIASLLNPFKAIYEAGKIIEQTPRLGVYQKALSKGLTGKTAGFLSREATVDFAKIGEAMRVFNQWTPFVNARLQGTINIGKALVEAKNSPKKAAELALKISGLAVAPFVATYYWNTTKYPEVWDDIADYDKANYIIGIYGDTKDEDGNYIQVVKIPKGSWNYFIDPVQDFLEWQRGNTPNLFSQIAQDTLFNILPISGAAQTASFPQRLGLSLAGTLPPPLKAAGESALGTSFYTGKPIVPQSMQNVSPELQYKKNTTQIAKTLGEWLGVSPLLLENAIRSMTGEAGMQIMGIGGTIQKPGLTFPFGKGFEKRFMIGSGGQKEQREITKIKEKQTEMYDRGLIEKRAAENTLEAIMKASSAEEAQQIIQDISDDEGIKTKLKSVIENEVIPYTFELLKSISPKERAEYIWETMQSTKSTEEIQPLLQEWEKAGIITDETRKYLKILMFENQWNS